MQSQNDRYASLQLLRYLIPFTILSQHWSDHYYDDLLPQVQLPVDFFFIIEGFLCSPALQDPMRAPVFYPLLRRAASIYPLYLIGLTAGVVAAAAFGSVGYGSWSLLPFIQAAFRGIVFFPSFAPVAEGAVFPFNPPSWAIVLELYAFAIASAMHKSMSRAALLVFVCGAAAVYLLSLYHFRNLNLGWRAREYIGGFPRVAYDFFGGILLYRYGGAALHKLPKLHPMLILAAYFTAIFLHVRFSAAVLVTIVGAPLVVALGAVSSNPSWILAIGRSAGRYAYALYLLPFPIIAALKTAGERLRLAPAVLQSPLAYVVVAGAGVAIAHLIARHVAEPAGAWIGGKLDRRERPAS